MKICDFVADPRGVFASYVDVTYDASKVFVNGAVTRRAIVSEYVHGSISTPGLLDEVGSAALADPLGLGQFLLFSLPMQATAEGTVDFAACRPRCSRCTIHSYLVRIIPCP